MELDVDPASATVPAAVAATGFRIVQEALTNVVRHAAGAEVRVRVTPGGRRLVIDVVDDGRRRRTRLGGARRHRQRHPGHERAALAAGGALEAGPGPGGGWRVPATLPVAAA